MKKSEKCETMSPTEAAEILGISAQAVRVQMQAGVLPIGDILPGSGKNRRNRYLIYREKLYRHIGRDPGPSIDQVAGLLQGLLDQCKADAILEAAGLGGDRNA